MASIQCHGKHIVISSFSTINIYTPESNFHLKIPISGDRNKKNSSSETNNRILCMTFSTCGHYFAACNDNKYLAVWDTRHPTWLLLFHRLIARKAVRICFTSANKLLVADKAGDVYEIDGLKIIEDLKLIPFMGHTSMLLDMVLSKDEKLLITCDRDEKIRISHFPNSYNIKCYCLGHTEYVITVLIIPNSCILVSGSGDGTVRFWSLKDGLELEKILCENFLSGTESSFTLHKCSAAIPSEIHREDSDGSKEICVAAVKSLKYSSKDNILVVMFTAFNAISLFKIEPDAKVNYRHIQNLQFTDEIWDADFDEDGMLWILLANPSEILSIYYPTTTDKIQFEKLVDVPNCIRSTVDSIKGNWDFFKDSLNVKDEHYTLYKQWYDNVKAYYERKEERINHLTKKKKPQFISQ